MRNEIAVYYRSYRVSLEIYIFDFVFTVGLYKNGYLHILFCSMLNNLFERRGEYKEKRKKDTLLRVTIEHTGIKLENLSKEGKKRNPRV